MKTYPIQTILAALAALLCPAAPLPAQLLSNLHKFPDRIAVGDPQTQANENKEGPKGLASADFNGDGRPDLAAGNLDGTITILTGLGDSKFAPPLHLRTEADELRAVLAADLNGDGIPDLAAASPLDGKLLVYFNPGNGQFSDVTPLPGWVGVRSLAAGDFDGDGVMDLAAAGPGLGLRHFRGTGGGAFEIMGDLPRLSPSQSEIPRPVYALRTLRSLDGLRDDLVVTHADSPALWILSTVAPDRSQEAPMDLTRLPGWGTLPSPVLLHEVLVHNADTLRDADGSAQPWAELLNKSNAPVDLGGWKLMSESSVWTLPAVTVAPGRMLVVFLSGKNRNTGPELHASFLLQQNSADLSLLRPDGTEANRFNLASHSVADISYGLAPDLDAVKYFDVPSPGAENNAGFSGLDDLGSDTPGETTLTVTPRDPAPGESAVVRVTIPARLTGTSSVRNVWFSATTELVEFHHLLHRTSPGVYELTLPPGAMTGTTPHRVLARLRDGSGNDYTIVLHRGLDQPRFEGMATPRSGRLVPVASIPSPKVKSFEIGAVRTKASQQGAMPDLVLADEDCGLLRVHRAAPGARRFAPMPSQDEAVRGAPRDVKLADIDGDGWLDATVVLRSLDLATTYRNNGGVLKPTGELPTGRSPREAVMADFTGDGRPDAAVINRYSADVSILPSSLSQSGLVSLDQIYSVNGEVAGLAVMDMNDDGLDDVVQLHRGSSEISIRFAASDGTLGAPVFRGTGTGGQAPSGMAFADLNGDEFPDLLTANLGRGGSGSISVILGTAEGTGGTPRTFFGGGSMFALSVADFNNDGNADIVAGLFDCHVTFFWGDGTGNFTPGYSTLFAYEARVMVTGDFDQDGDVDIAGAGYTGDMVTLENRGAGSATEWFKRTYNAPSGAANGTERIALSFLNADSDPDLVLGTGNGVLAYTGGPGMEFQIAPEFGGGVGFSVSDVFTRDLDGDGTLEMVAACRNASCINILTQASTGEFVLVTQADVPSGRYLASGDLDGDGEPDLVGTGDILWTVLSSRPPASALPESGETNRPQSSATVVNEVLSRNTGVPLAADNGRKSDFVEMYNGASTPTDMAGWTIRLLSVQEGAPVDQSFTLPSVTASAKGHSVVVFSEDPGTLHTGFTLPAEGGTLILLAPDGSEADRVVYPPAQENVSWSRYLDGHPSFHADRIPSPGMSNLDNGTVPPDVQLTPPSPAMLASGQALRFTARGKDDAGILSLSLLWNRLDAPYAEPQRLILYDDGMHQDEGAVDGFFAGQMSEPLPSGAEVQFYLEAVDLSGEVLLLPDAAELKGPGEAPVAWSFSLTAPPTLEIVEICSNNQSLRRDEIGQHPDYITVRNTGTSAVDMSTVLLAKSPLAARTAVYAFPAGLMLAAGAEITIFADNNPERGALHAPFTLDAGGDDIALLALRPSGARQWIHSLEVPAMTEDARLTRLPGTSLRAVLTPTDAASDWNGITYNRNGDAFATVVFTAVPGFNYTLQGDAPGLPIVWATLGTVAADGAVRTLTRPLAQFAALRIVSVPTGPFPIRLDSAQVASTVAGIFGQAAPSASSISLFYGTTNGGSNPASWQNERISSGPDFAFELTGLAPGSTYYYNLRATHSAPGATPVVTWLATSLALNTLPVGVPVPEALVLTALNPTDFTVEIKVFPPPPPGSTVTLLAGTSDAFTNVPGWFLHMPSTPTAVPHTWTASISGLERNTEYFVRAVLATPTGESVSVRRLRIRTPNARENLATNLRLSEIMYHPVDANAAESAAGFEQDDFEYIELHNASTESMDLSGLWFEHGLDFDFPFSGAPVIPPNGYAVIAANPHAFAMRYGASIPLAGWTLHPFRRARLANSGERITLRDADGTVLFSLEYDDSPWTTDGYGFSLEFHPSSNFLDPEVADDYTASRTTGGTPGQPALPEADLDFTAWSHLSFGAGGLNDPGISGLDRDPDHDGLINFLEFVFGTDPLVPGTPDMLRLVDGAPPGYLRLTFPVNIRANIRLALTVSKLLPGPFATGTLAQYHPMTGLDRYWASATVLSADGTQLLFTVDVSKHPTEPGYFRLEAYPN